EEILDVRPVGVTDGFFDLGGHSLAAVRLMAAVRRQFGRDLPLSTLFRGATVESLAAILRTSGPAPAASPLVPLTPLRAGSDRPPLFCVHGAGGGVLVFTDLARGLGEDQPLYALEARGLDRVEAMAGAYLEAIRTVQSEGPYHLLGYSMGGKIAFEMARRLERDGQEVALLTLIDIPAVPSPAALEAEDRLAVPPEIAGLPDFDASTAERYLAVYRANREASRAYVPGPYEGRLLLLTAEDGNGRDAADPTLGWEAFAAGGVEVHRLPGGHYTLLGAAYAGAVVDLLRERLAQTVPA
ncbi:non-ribosomal peptide synthetase, partial [bacterium]